MPPLKGRPPNLRLQTESVKQPSQSNTIIELETPIDQLDDEDLLQLSSPSSTSSESPKSYQSTLETDSDPNSDDISRDLAALEKLRRSVHRNLRLRPIRSSSSLRVQGASPYSPSSAQLRDTRSPSPDPSLSPASVYYTPTSALYSEPDDWRSSSSSSSSASGGLEPALLISRLTAPTRPILIDTRPTAAYLADHLEHSVNIHTIPSLILKRSKKPHGGLHDVFALRQWITTEEGKHCWDDMMNSGDWDGDVIVFDESMDEGDRVNPQATAWILLTLVAPLLEHGTVDYLQGGFSAARQHPYLRQHILSNHAISVARPPTRAPKANGKHGGGLFQLDISVATRPRDLPELEFSAVSPKPMMPAAIAHWESSGHVAPSPAPSALGFSRPPPPRRPSIPTLRKLDTTSTERLNAGLPRLQMPQKAATLAAPPSGLRSRSRSPSHLRLDLPPPSPPGSARLLSANSAYGPDSLPPPSPSWALPSTPRTPYSPRTPVSRSPSTARPDSSQPPTTEEPFPVFTVSTILPNFLFLGPELTTEEHVDELQSLGVKRILNIAAECDDDHGLRLRERFDRYIRIPMRDTVEEDNITRGVREVCEILDDARLHSSATYVHCKAGKSRSVTAVMAYLIHANHWTLSRAYAFVLERRKGISPNIGFVSELMTFEEQELGGKSVGVVKMSSSAGAGDADGDTDSNRGGGNGGGGANYGVALGGRRPQHIRESLPPLFSLPNSFAGISGPPVMDATQIGDSGQETEIKDATGRYRHMRRAPVDEATLQPMRRVSKAGLESAAYASHGVGEHEGDAHDVDFENVLVFSPVSIPDGVHSS